MVKPYKIAVYKTRVLFKVYFSTYSFRNVYSWMIEKVSLSHVSHTVGQQIDRYSIQSLTTPMEYEHVRKTNKTQMLFQMFGILRNAHIYFCVLTEF